MTALVNGRTNQHTCLNEKIKVQVTALAHTLRFFAKP
jgi:hypothetical protein